MFRDTHLIDQSDEVLGGVSVFGGTRVPIQTLFDYLESDHRLDEFLDDFPTVGREQAIHVLEYLKEVALAKTA